jgi:hypothetical protein
MVEKSNGGSEMNDAAFLERVAVSLRSPEHAHPSFERRVMEKVRAEGPALYASGELTHHSWWRTARPFNVSPLTAIALAASVLVVVALSGVLVGTRLASRSSSPIASTQATVAHDTVQLVRFVFEDSKASSVQLVGDFNEWTKGATQLKPSGARGVWTVSVPLTPGRHEYAFIVNGSRWVVDPLALKSSDDFGTESSVIRVDSNVQRTT